MKRRFVFSFFVAMLFFVSAVVEAESFCGDDVCDDVLEDEVSCAQDCFDDVEGILEGQGYVTLESGVIVDEEYASDFELREIVNSEEQDNGISFELSLAFKIIIIALVLVVIAIVGFFVYNKSKRDENVSEGSVPVESSI